MSEEVLLRAIRLMASFLYARRIISKVSAPDLPSFTQNLMSAVRSSFTSMLKSQMWRHTWWQVLVLCNSQCSHSDAPCSKSQHTHSHNAIGWRSMELVSKLFDTPSYCHLKECRSMKAYVLVGNISHKWPDAWIHRSTLKTENRPRSTKYINIRSTGQISVK
jgi:hypothetical protein